MQYENFIDSLAQVNQAPVWFTVVTCPAQRVSYWTNETPLLKKPYVVKAQVFTWCKVSANWDKMSAPSGSSCLQDSEFKVVFYMAKNKSSDAKKGLLDHHFPFGTMRHLDNSVRHSTHALRSTWYQLPYLEKKTIDNETEEPINLAQKPLAEGERLVCNT